MIEIVDKRENSICHRGCEPTVGKPPNCWWVGSRGMEAKHKPFKEGEDCCRAMCLSGFRCTRKVGHRGVHETHFVDFSAASRFTTRGGD